MHLQMYEWVIVGVAVAFALYPDAKKLWASGVWTKLRERFSAKKDVGEDVPPQDVPTAADNSAFLDRVQEAVAQHSVYQSFLNVRNAVKCDAKAVEALDRLVLSALVSGAADQHYTVTWDGKAVAQ